MLSLILAVLLGITIVVLLVTAYCLHLTREQCAALEEGFVEVTDAYESDSLSWMDTDVKNLERITNLEERCQDLASEKEALSGRLDETQDLLAEKVVLLNIAITILKRHDEKCLPTIAEEDEILLKDLLEHVDSP